MSSRVLVVSLEEVEIIIQARRTSQRYTHPHIHILGGHPKEGFLVTLPLPVNETQFMKQETGIMPLCRCLSCRIVTTTVFRYQEKACHKLDASDMESDIKCRTSRNTNQDFQLVTVIMREDVKKAKHNDIKLTTRRMHC